MSDSRKAGLEAEAEEQEEDRALEEAVSAVDECAHLLSTLRLLKQTIKEGRWNRAEVNALQHGEGCLKQTLASRAGVPVSAVKRALK